MSDQSAVDHDLYRRTKALLEPGDVELIGCIVHTDLAGDEDLEMQELVVKINEVISDHADAGETFIYAGNDDTDFSSNQYQGLTVDDESFVWESQHLLRDGSFDLVFYYEADVDQEGVVADLEALGPDVTSVPNPEIEAALE
ncbi:MAG: hypothetical protein J07HB67_01752 [halophilic archaeon J07HB67]|jgi:hypothetical protein|nr:MAG: hypothetical protein J07HB67_01752 [halophilic archaeon J07HB67]